MTTTETDFLPGKLKEMQRISLLAGGIGIIILILCWFAGVANFYQAWLVGWLFAFSFALGGILICCIHNLAHGGWGFLLRRMAEASAMTITPVMLLFLPIMFSLDRVYPWAIRGPDGISVYSTDPVVGSKLHYLNHSFFWLRYIFFAVAWSGVARLFWFYSGKQDETGDMVWRKKMRAIAGPVALGYILTLTWASVDWVMSLEPQWFSSIYGVMMASGHMLTLLTFGIVFLAWLSKWEPVKTAYTVERQHDLGKLLFAFTIFWTYIQLSQFIIIWHANLPEEITWYMNRWSPGFNAVSWVLLLSQFFVPFLILINRTTKRNRYVLTRVAAAYLVVRVIDLFWMVAPSIHMPETRELYPVATKAMSGSAVSLLDLLAPVSFGLFWFGLFLYYFRQRPILPVNDPYFSLGTEHKEPQS